MTLFDLRVFILFAFLIIATKVTKRFFFNREWDLNYKLQIKKINASYSKINTIIIQLWINHNNCSRIKINNIELPI